MGASAFVGDGRTPIARGLRVDGDILFTDQMHGLDESGVAVEHKLTAGGAALALLEPAHVKN